MARPPAALVTARRSAPCAAAMARTMASPRPSPPGARRAGSIRWNGRNSLPSWSGGMTGPELVTARNGHRNRFQAAMKVMIASAVVTPQFIGR